MPEYTHILYEQRGAIVEITLNRPEKLNALNSQMMYDLDSAFDRIKSDTTVHVAIIKGAGRAFCSGYDLSPTDEISNTIQGWRDHATRAGRDVVMKIWDLRVPVITAVHSYALGGGCDIVLASDITILADDAKIGEPEVRHVSSPPTYIMPWVIGIKKAKELLLMGDMIDAQEAFRLGIANKVVPASRLQEEAWSIAEKLARIPAISVELNKRAINHAYESMGLRCAIDYGVETFTMLLMTQEAAEFDRLVAEKGLKAALEERNRQFEG
jgi:enoyl-CoA hydratase/carnithine racemase